MFSVTRSPRGLYLHTKHVIGHPGLNNLTLEFSPDGKRCVAGGGFNGCVVVHTIEPACATRFNESKNVTKSSTSLHYAAASAAYVVTVVGEQVLVSSRDDCAQKLVIDLEPGTQVKSLQGISSVPMLRPMQNTGEDDAHVALVLNCSTVAVFSLRSGKELYRIEKHALIMRVDYSYDGTVQDRGGVNVRR